MLIGPHDAPRQPPPPRGTTLPTTLPPHRYFDKLIMPQAKWGATPTPAGIDGLNPGNDRRNNPGNDRPPRYLQRQRTEGGNAQDGGGNRRRGSSKGRGGFPRSEASATKKRGSAAAGTSTGVGGGSGKPNTQNTGLKLTLKERLDK